MRLPVEFHMDQKVNHMSLYQQCQHLMWLPLLYQQVFLPLLLLLQALHGSAGVLSVCLQLLPQPASRFAAAITAVNKTLTNFLFFIFPP